jgi:hypothetical protein
MGALRRIKYQITSNQHLKMSSEEKTLIWWQPSDFYMFKKTSKMIAKEILRRQSDETTPSSYSSILQRTYSVCSQTAEEANVGVSFEREGSTSASAMV